MNDSESREFLAFKQGMVQGMLYIASELTNDSLQTETPWDSKDERLANKLWKKRNSRKVTL